MKKLMMQVSFAVVTLIGSSAGNAFAAISLDDAYQATLTRNEDAASQNESVLQAEERYNLARSALFPNINLVGAITKQDNPPAGTGSSISPADQRTLKITATQPLFRGFREWAGLKQQAILSDAAKLNRDLALTQLYLDVSDIYFQAMIAQTDIQDLQKELDANKKRREELLRFRRLGRSRDTEVLTTEANVAALEASLEGSSTTLQNSLTAFTLLTGLPADSKLVDREVYPESLPPLSTFLAKIEDRPDIRTLAQNVEASDKGISIARGGHLPSLDLSGNYYFMRPGVLEDVKWDVTLSLTFPIFQGGAILSQTHQAVSIHKQDELALEKARRIARQQIETLYASIQSDRAQIIKQKRSAEASDKSYQAQIRDYRLGIVTNIDVLQQLNGAQAAQRALDRVEILFKSDYIKLLGATAARPYPEKGTKQ